jgi:hypothetical protein
VYFCYKLIPMPFSTIFFITVFMLAFVFAGIGIKILFKKDGKFSGTCASQSPFLNKEGEACGICGAKPEEKCKNEEG